MVSKMVIIGAFWNFGIFMFILTFIFPICHYLLCLTKSNNLKYPEKQNFTPNLTILLPVKNESKVICDKLTEIINMDYPNKCISILIIDSGSSDQTSLISKEFLSNNALDINWSVISLDKPGKSVAVNHALNIIDDEYMVMMDAEAILEPSTLKSIIHWFNDPKVGGVCGQLRRNQDDPDGKYRGYYNIVRVGESAIYSTPIFEGSICAFRIKSLNSQKINSNINSDDTQLALMSLSSGYRTIMDPNIKFNDSLHEGKHRRIRQLRRGQGIVRTLLMNRNMILNKQYGYIFAHTFYFHIIMPWLFVMSLFSLITAVILSIIQNSFFNYNKYEFFILLFFISIFIKFIRNLLFGISVLIEAQILLLFGIKLHIWKTNEIAREKSNILRKS